MWGGRQRIGTLLFRKDGFTKMCLCKSSAASPGITEHGNIKPLEDMPTPGGVCSLPLIGPMFLFYPFSKYAFTNLHELLDKLHDKYGVIFKLKFAGQTFVVVEDPTDIENVFRSEGKYPSRKPHDIYLHYAKKKKKEKNLGVVNGEEWFRMRHQVQKTMMRPSAPRGYLSIQNEIADDFVGWLGTTEHKQEELRDAFFKYAMESISVVCFNKRFRCFSRDPKGIDPKYNNYVEVTKKLFYSVAAASVKLPLYKLFPTPSYRTFEKTADEAHRLGKELLEEAIDEVHRKEKKGVLDPTEPNLIWTMLSKTPNLDEINAMTLGLLVAGTHSTARNVEFFLLSLALNPEKQEDLYKEIETVVGSDGKLTPELADMMPYYKACFRESMRLNYPLAIGTSRNLETDVVLSGYRVPKETCVLLNNNRAVRNPEFFENPDQYIPERWQRGIDGRLKQPHPPFALLPFGFGVRNCVGRRFAEQEVWLAVIKIIRKFKVSVSEEDKHHEILFHLFRTTKRPIHFTFTSREGTRL